MVQLLVLSLHSKKALGLTLLVGWSIAVWHLCLHEVPVLVFLPTQSRNILGRLVFLNSH